MKALYILIVSSVLITSCKKQQDTFASHPLNVSVVYNKVYSIAAYNNLHTVTSTNDGGCIAGGSYSFNYGTNDCYILKVDASGNKQWDKQFGGSGYDRVIKIFESQKGFFGIAQTFSSDRDINDNHGSMDMLVFELDKNGNLLWQKNIGTEKYDGVAACIKNADGSFMIAGSIKDSSNLQISDGWICKMSSTGDVIWEKTFGGSNDDSFSSLVATTDGGYVVTGITNSTDGDLEGNQGQKDWVAKIDRNGNKVWTKTYGCSGANSSFGVVQSGNGFIVIGTINSGGGDVTSYYGSLDTWIFKLDAVGNLVWQKTLVGTNTDTMPFITNSIDGNILVSSISASNDGDYVGHKANTDAWIIKMDNNGNLMGKQNMGGSGFDVINNLYSDAKGNYYAVGNTNSMDAGIEGVNGINPTAWIFKFQDVPK